MVGVGEGGHKLWETQAVPRAQNSNDKQAIGR